MDTLFSHVTVLTMDARMSLWTDAFVGVTDGKISWLAKKAPEEQPQKIIDGSGMVLLPGLDETVVHWITVVDGVFMLISFVSYILAYYGKSKKVQDL